MSRIGKTIADGRQRSEILAGRRHKVPYIQTQVIASGRADPSQKRVCRPCRACGSFFQPPGQPPGPRKAFGPQKLNHKLNKCTYVLVIWTLNGLWKNRKDFGKSSRVRIAALLCLFYIWYVPYGGCSCAVRLKRCIDQAYPDRIADFPLTSGFGLDGA